MKRAVAGLILAGIFFSQAGCQIEKIRQEKLRDLEYTVLQEHEIPEEFQKELEKGKKAPFQMSYKDQETLYVARGYGEQEMSGYRITVDEFYESENAVCIHTNLLGPEKGEEVKEEEVKEEKTYPYLVIKTEFIDKHIVFK